MYYSESEIILAKIQASKRILLNCHRNPDSDSVGCATSLAHVIKSMGKEVSIICPNKIPRDLLFLTGADLVEEVVFDEYNYSEFDLFILCDTSSWQMVMNSPNASLPSIPVIVIDNHETNEGFGDINLLDFKTSSVAEVLYNIFQDWNISITMPLANNLLAGMIGDTGSFQYEIYKDTFRIANDLLDHGADIAQINTNLFNTKPLLLIEFWGVVIDHLKVDNKGNGFAWSAIPYSQYEKYKHLKGGKESSATMFLRKVENTEFGFVMTEDEPQNFSISFRARTDFNVADIALMLGGGGHPGAAGARIEGKTFDEAVSLVLELCRKQLK